MGADHVLELEVVTADGRFVTANAQQNSDLFWALRGGGGSTFGVVTSVVVKAHEDMPVTTVSFSFSTTNLTSFWSAVEAYMETFPAMVDAGIYSYFNMLPGTFNMAPIFAPGLSAAEVNALMAPFYNKLNELRITYSPSTTEHSSFYPAWQSAFPKELIGFTNVQSASRLFPRDNWSAEKFPITFAAFKEVVTAQGHFIGFNIAPTLAAGGNPDNSVNPAWRTCLMHAISGASWPVGASEDVIQAARDDLTYVQMEKWRSITPGSGSYLGESDIREPNFQQAFYGSFYDRLYTIKQKLDPKGVFFAVTVSTSIP
jgi:FAD/FMN-containing dehydrogenase